MKRIEISTQDLRKTDAILRQGGVIAFPTETSYGLGCDPRDARAVRRIFKIKDRDPKKPLLLVAGSWAQVERVACLSMKVRRFAQGYWPGALTLILPVREEASLVAGVAVKGEVAIRYSSSPIVRRLTRRFGFPIVATSANISGQLASRSAKEVCAAGLEVDFVLDGGVLSMRKPSTVVRVREDGEVEVVRVGAIPTIPFIPLILRGRHEVGRR